jgi:hypothetical protein
MGHAARVGIAAAGAGAATRELDFLSCDVGKRGNLIVSPGIRGSRSYFDEQAVMGTYGVDGTLLLDCRPDDLAVLLPYCLGANANGTSFALASTVQEMLLTVDKVAKVYTYDEIKVNRARFSGGPNQTLKLALELAGKTESGANAGTFPDLASTLSAVRPYVFHQGVLTLGANTTYEFTNFELVIDNALILDRYNNSQTRTEIPESDRIITLTCDTPFTSSELALYDLSITGLAGSLVFTNGNYSLTFTLNNLKQPALGPGVPAKQQEILQRLTLQAFATDNDDELVVTNDSTG